jgi:DNA-binding NtrC family response regulator
MPSVLIVEDEEMIRVLAESILQEHHFTTITAANATEALAVLKTDARVDLMFTDINMGAENGIDLAIAARQLRPELKVLYTTGAGVTDGTRARFVEGFHFLPKAYRLDELLQAVMGLLGSNPP